jgi:hypothetical protein
MFGSRSSNLALLSPVVDASGNFRSSQGRSSCLSAVGADGDGPVVGVCRLLGPGVALDGCEAFGWGRHTGARSVRRRQ